MNRDALCCTSKLTSDRAARHDWVLPRQSGLDFEESDHAIEAKRPSGVVDANFRPIVLHIGANALQHRAFGILGDGFQYHAAFVARKDDPRVAHERRLIRVRHTHDEFRCMSKLLELSPSPE